MGVFARGKNALAISDRSGLRFPYIEMVREWNGSLVHFSEFEAKQPQLSPKPVGSDPQALYNPRVQRASTAGLILLNPNPFEIIISGGITFVNVFSQEHQRATGDIVRLRGPVTSNPNPGAGGPDTYNLQYFTPILTLFNVSDIDNANGFTITVGQKQANGTVVTSAGTLADPENYFFFTSVDNANTSNRSGGGFNCSAGPVTLEAL